MVVCGVEKTGMKLRDSHRGLIGCFDGKVAFDLRGGVLVVCSSSGLSH